MIDAVVYDFGGVFMASPFEALRQIAVDKGSDYETVLRLLMGPYDEDTDHPWHQAERGQLAITDARDQILELSRQQELELDLFEMFSQLGSNTSVVEPMVDTVRRARARGCKTAILTNNFVEGRDFWRAMLPLDELFDLVVDSSEIGMRKPDPRIYRHVLDGLGGIAPERSVFLDDYPGNVTAAEAIGMIGILVDPDPTAAIARLDELLVT